MFRSLEEGGLAVRQGKKVSGGYFGMLLIVIYKWRK